jgi:PadR family transcriptional regulator PadR
MRTRLQPGDLDACIMALLVQGDSELYAIATALAAVTDAGEGAIYPAIRRMAHADWLSSYLVEVNDGPPQRYYRMEAKGRDALANLLITRQRVVDEVKQALWGAAP